MNCGNKKRIEEEFAMVLLGSDAYIVVFLNKVNN